LCPGKLDKDIPLCPDFFDIRQTFSLRPTFPCISPTRRVLTICRPDGILFFMVENYLINSFIFLFISIYLRLLLISALFV
jgi:hypothetical protein